jgi:hypothetical protein
MDGAGTSDRDLRTLAWSAYDGHTVSSRHAKTGTSVALPVVPELRHLLDSILRRSTQIVTSENTGRPYQESDFQHTFAGIRQRAGLADDLRYRDLGRTLPTAPGATGCSDDQIRSITGRKTRSIVAVYVRSDDTFARGAMGKLQRSRRNSS